MADACPAPTLTLSGSPVPGNNTYGVTLVVPAEDPAPTESVGVSDGTNTCDAALSNPSSDGVTYTGSCAIDAEAAGAAVTATYDEDGGDGNYSAATSNSLTIGGPVVNAGGTANFSGGGSPVALDPALSVSDASSTTLSSATVAITSGFLAGDTLEYAPTADISKRYDPSTGVLSLSGVASLAAYQATLDTVSYTYAGDPTNGGADTTRVITWSVNDGTYSSSQTPPATSTLDTVQSGPVTCPSGQYLPAGQSACTPASPGYYVAPGTTTETPCAAGTYQPNRGQISCQSAPSGTYVGSTGAVAPTPCPAGTYSSTNGATSCTLASPGYYVPSSGARLLGAQNQTACAVGTYQPAYGQSSCISAGAGYYVSVQASATESPCALGTWSGTGAATCVPVGAPTAAITPLTGGPYAVGQVVPTTFSCTDASNAPGIVSCDDNHGKNTVSGGSGTLNTSSSGPFTYMVTATSADGQSATASVTYSVADTVTVTNPGTQTSVSGTVISGLQIAAGDSLATASLTYAAAGLPTGLSINSASGLISGTPTTAGTYSVKVTATDGGGYSGSSSFTWNVTYTVSVTNPGTQSSFAGTAVTPLQIVGADSSSTASLTYAATGLPTGLSINASTGLISGTPTSAAGSPYGVKVTVTDNDGFSGSTSFTWDVTAITVSLTNPGTQSTTTGTAVSLQITASDSAKLSLAYSATGLPTGLSISSSGLITGKPTTTGSYSVKVSAQDATGASATATFTWSISQAQPPTTLTLLPVPNGAIRTGSPVAYGVVVTKGSLLPFLSGTVSFTANGSPIAGCSKLPVLLGVTACVTSFATGGSYTVVATYSGDATYGPSSATLTQLVDQAPAITSAAKTTVATGKSFTFAVTATGYPAPTFTESGALPKGVTLSSSGTLSGTPSGSAASYVITITATNAAGSAQQSFTLTT